MNYSPRRRNNVDMRTEFQVHLLSDSGIEKAQQLAEVFSDALDKIEKLVPAGRERALVVTKLQEACFFAKRGIGLDPENRRETHRWIVDQDETYCRACGVLSKDPNASTPCPKAEK